MSKLLMNGLLAMVIFLAINAAAQAAPAGSGSAFIFGEDLDYNEECNNEGCSNGELAAMYRSVAEECLNEGCWHEEVVEVSGGHRYDDQMFDAFRRRLGKDLNIKYRTEPRPKPRRRWFDLW